MSRQLIYRFLLGVLCCSPGIFSPAALAQGHNLERDPTRPLNYQASTGKVTGTKTSELRLASVLISAQRKLAIINGHSLREGQSIPGSNATLVSIHSHGVWVQEPGKRFELRLAPSVIKKN